MQHAEIIPGTAVVARGEPCLIVEAQTLTEIKVQSIESRLTFLVDVEDLKFFPSTIDGLSGAAPNYQQLRDLDYYTAEQISVAYERFLILKRFRAGELTCKQAMNLTGMSKSAFYRLNRRFDEDTGAESLLPNKSGREKGATRLDDDVEEIVAQAFKKIYKGHGATYSRVWKEVQAQCTRQNLPIPSPSAVRARVKAVGEQSLYKLKYGSEAAQQKYGPKPGRIKLSRPLERVQMDHTLVDCILVDEVTRRPLFRPWLTIIVDQRTRVLLGYYVAFHAPSTLSVACAITHAVLPKRQYLNNIGRGNIEHPFYGVPEIIQMDNAKEFSTYKLKKACAINGITPDWRPIGKKHFGGNVERLLGTLMIGRVKLLPGRTMSNVIEKGDYDSEKHAALTISEFIRWFAGEVEVYNYSNHSALTGSPAEEWLKYYRADSGTTLTPKLITNPLHFRLDFMPEEQRDIRPVGVLLFNRAYWSPALKAHIGLKGVTIKYDPFSLRCIWAKIGGDYIELKFSDLTTDDLSYEQHLAINYEALRNRSKAMPQNVIATLESNERLVRESKSATRKAKRRAKAEEAYLRHVSDQHVAITQRSGAKETPSSIDFTKSPTIFHGEDL